jgi:spermidine synthase
MIPWKKLDTASIPGADGELRLMQRGEEFAIMLGSNQLMSSRLTGSEVALATLTIRQLATTSKPRILVGGLGMGFTLRAALTVLPRDAEVIVAELVPAVVAWARGPMAALHGDSLSDPRVTIREADVGAVIGESRNGLDAILLDVDNGPEGLTRKHNDGLYDERGLANAHAALRPGGVLAVWSSGPDAAFTKRLRAAGFGVNEVAVRATGTARGTRGGARHVIWLATKP